MNKIDRIIKEEINRFILSEVINFNNLNTLASKLNDSLGNIRNFSANKGLDKRLRKFFYDFVVYCLQIINAINRCAKANSLNEASWGGLSNYGINLPPELGGNIWSDAKEGYYGTKNFFERGRGYGAVYGNSANGVNQNSVPSVKLQVLLQKVQEWQTRYRDIYRNFGLGNNQSYQQIVNDFNNIIVGNNSIIPNIVVEYQRQLQNAQNP